MSYHGFYKRIFVFVVILILIISSFMVIYGERSSKLSNNSKEISIYTGQGHRQPIENNKTIMNFSAAGCNGTYIEDGNVILSWEPPQNPYQEDESTKLLCHFDNIYTGEDNEVAMGVDKSCIAYYKFDEGIGTVAHDSSGKENHGTINEATWVDGKYGKGLYLSGVVTSYVITNPIKHISTNDITAMFWMKTTDITNGGTPISYASSVSDNDIFIGNYQSFTIYKGVESTNTLVAANDGSWRHIAVTWENSTGRLILYKDGTSAYSNTLAAGQGLTPGGSLVIGQDQDNVGGGFQGPQAFLGTIDEVAIFNRNIPADEIAKIYKTQYIKFQDTPNQTSFENGKLSEGVKIEKDDTLAYPIGPTPDSSCKGLWKFDEGTGTTVSDSSGNGNHGTWNGWSTANWTDGIYGKALVYDGIDDYVQLGDIPLTDLTISQWVKADNLAFTDVSLVTRRNGDTTPSNYQTQLNGNKFKFSAYIGGWQWWLSTKTLNQGQWYFLTATVYGNTLQLYINGKLDSVHTIPDLITTGTQTTSIGQKRAAGPWYEGIIDEVNIYNREKSAEEVYTEYLAAGQNNFDIHQGTIEMWVKPDWNGNDGESHTIFFTGKAWNNDSFFIYKDSDDFLKFITADNYSNFQGYPEVDISNWKKDTWYHLTFTWDSLGTKSIYIDGYLINRAYNNYMPALTHDAINIGSTHQNFSSFEGIIDELRVSDKVREAYELRAYHSSGTYESEVIDANESVGWDKISWNAEIPGDTSLYLQTRTSNDNVTWAPWTGNTQPSDVEPKAYLDSTGEQINASPARYIQWRAVQKSVNGVYTPVLINVTITWNHLPKIFNVTLSPSKPTIHDDLIIDYDYSDADGHTESDTKFEWLVDRGTGMFVSSGIKTQNLDSQRTSFQERWYCEITPHDGYNYGFLVTSPTVTIMHGEITKLEITPEFTVVTTDDQVQFTAKAFDSANNEVTTTFNWNVSGGGSVDQNGLFVPTTTGMYGVYADAEGVYGAALVNVLPGNLHHIIINPDNPEITTDDIIEFEATFYDAENNTIPDLKPTWNVTGGGIIDIKNGTFEATTPGQYTMTAENNSITGSTGIRIKSGAPDRLNLTPENPTITADDQLQFNVEAFDKDNNEITTNFEWITENGYISSNGLFTPEKTGIWKISVLFNESGIETNTTVTITHGILTKLELDPDEYIMSIDDEIKFTTIGSDSKNNQWTDVEDVVWSIDNSTLGEITQDGTFHAKSSGSVTVSATVTENSTTRANGNNQIVGEADITVSTDGDNDGMFDEWEREFGLNFKDDKDANWDSDGDGLTNADEYQYDTDPRNSDTDNDGYSDKKEIDEGTDPTDKSDHPAKRAEAESMQMLFYIIIIILIIIILALIVVFTRRKREKPAEEEEEAAPEEEDWEEAEEEEEEAEEGEEAEELEEEEPEEIDLEEFKEEPEFEEPVAAEEPISEEEEMIDMEVGEEAAPKKAKIKGKMPIAGKLPKKGKLPMKPEKVIEPAKIDKTREYAPELVKLEDKSVSCGICLGAIKTGLMAIKCWCGKYYHESCGVRVGECPRCERKFKIEQLAKMKEEEVEEIEEMEESELSAEEFEKQKEEKKKAEREKVAKILSGLEVRLAAGEISESTYLMLRKKYEK